MIDATGKPLYVSKAKKLRSRISSYTRLRGLPERMRVMVARTANLEIINAH